MNNTKQYYIWQHSNTPDSLYNNINEIKNKTIKDYIEELKSEKSLRKTLKLLILIAWLVLILDVMVMINFNINSIVVETIGFISLICAFFIGLPALKYLCEIDDSMPKELLLYSVVNIQKLNNNEIYCTYKPYKYLECEESTLFKPNKIQYDLEENEEPYVEAYSYYFYETEIECLHLPKKSHNKEIFKLKCPVCTSNNCIIKTKFRKGTANCKMYWIECNSCGTVQMHDDLHGYKSIKRATNHWNNYVNDLIYKEKNYG